MILIGTLVHVVIGMLLAVLLSRSGLPMWAVISIMVSVAFYMKEVGEAKYQIPGSIKTLEKNLKMLAYPFKPKELPQWIAPGVGAALILWIL